MKTALFVLMMAVALPGLTKDEKNESKWAKSLREKMIAQQTKSILRL